MKFFTFLYLEESCTMQDLETEVEDNFYQDGGEHESFEANYNNVTTCATYPYPSELFFLLHCYAKNPHRPKVSAWNLG